MWGFIWQSFLQHLSNLVSGRDFPMEKKKKGAEYDLFFEDRVELNLFSLRLPKAPLWKKNK